MRDRDLAAEGAESEGIWEAAVADFAGEGDALPRSGLGALIQEHNLGAVDDVCLNAGDVDVSLDLVHPNHVVVRGSPNLQSKLSTHFQSQSRSLESIMNEENRWRGIN